MTLSISSFVTSEIKGEDDVPPPELPQLRPHETYNEPHGIKYGVGGWALYFDGTLKSSILDRDCGLSYRKSLTLINKIEQISKVLQKISDEEDVEPPSSLYYEDGRKRYQKRRRSGVVGVVWMTRTKSWCATWGRGEVHGTASFAVNKYGEEGALRLAVEKRKEMEALGFGAQPIAEKQSGVRGVHWNLRWNRWEATWREDGRQIIHRFPLIRFGNEEAALTAAVNCRKTAEERLLQKIIDT